MSWAPRSRGAEVIRGAAARTTARVVVAAALGTALVAVELALLIGATQLLNHFCTAFDIPPG